MNIIEKKKLVFDTIDTIKASLIMFGGSINNENYYVRCEEYTIVFYFNKWTHMKIHINLYSNMITVSVLSDKYEGFYIKNCFSAINATPKAIYTPRFGPNTTYHCFKISRANCDRLYNMFCVMAKL